MGWNPASTMKPAKQSKSTSPGAAGSLGKELNLIRRHLQFGWWTLLIFLGLGIALETLHGFKVGWYLNVTNETRRLMLRLAHTHGTLFGLVNIAFALTARGLFKGKPGRTEWISRFLMSGSLLLPCGFLLGGLFVYGGDPGLGILLVPVGALLVLLAVAGTALKLGRGSFD
jgi:hypothetical protein